MAHSISSS